MGLVNLHFNKQLLEKTNWDFLKMYLFYLFIFCCAESSLLHGLSPVAVNRTTLPLCRGFSLWWLLLLQSTGSRCTQVQ